MSYMLVWQQQLFAIVEVLCDFLPISLTRARDHEVCPHQVSYCLYLTLCLMYLCLCFVQHSSATIHFTSWRLHGYTGCLCDAVVVGELCTRSVELGCALSSSLNMPVNCSGTFILLQDLGYTQTFRNRLYHMYPYELVSIRGLQVSRRGRQI